MKAIPGFSFFDLGLDNFYPADEYGLVEMNEVAKSYLVCWNEGDDGPVMAGKGGWAVFSVIGPKRLRLPRKAAQELKILTLVRRGVTGNGDLSPDDVAAQLIHAALLEYDASIEENSDGVD